MKNKTEHYSFNAAFSLDPLLNFWKQNVTPMCSNMAAMFATFKEQIDVTPELQGSIKDLTVVERYQNLIAPLMSVVFPVATWETELSGALTPFDSRPVYVSPGFRSLFVNEDGALKGHLKEDHGVTDGGRLLRAFLQIAEKIYDIRQYIDTPVIRVIPDPKTGLDRYFRMIPDLRFVDVHTTGEVPLLKPEDRAVIIENMTDPEVLRKYLPPEKFELRGFTVVRAVDVTESEVISALERDLIHQESIFSNDGFRRLKTRLQTLFGKPDLMADMGALQGEQVLIINDVSQTEVNCIYTNSNHIPLSEIQGSVWLQAVEKGSTLRIPDLRAVRNPTVTEQHVAASGARSMLISPLFYQDSILGTLTIMSPEPNGLGPIEEMLLKQITPLFSVAMKRGLDEMDNQVQSIIKEKCTAVHPSVDWRFRQAALSHMDRLRLGQTSELEPIVFKNVVPLFAQSDIRGSSIARNRSIQTDLIEQLNLANKVMNLAIKIKPWPLLKEYRYRIENRIEEIEKGLSSGDETSVSDFLIHEVEPTYTELMGLGPQVNRAITDYKNTIDPVLGVVYRKRREFEESVSRLNERLSAYLDREETTAQSVYPHYFEKHQTDGLDYLIYVGASLRKDGVLNSFHVKNLRLWQFMVACGMARETEKVKPELKVSLDTCHLILVNQIPLSIRFRYDEKRFDVDGAYDVRQEIIKSRIDKASVRNTNERLTQPGHLAVVYSRPEEEKEIKRHIDFMQAQRCLLNNIEYLDLEDLPGVSGLKAIRVGIDLEAQNIVQLNQQMVG